MSYDEEQQKRSRVVVETPSERREVVHQQTRRYPDRQGFGAGTVVAVALTAIALTSIVFLFLMNSGDDSTEANINIRTADLAPTPLAQVPVMVQQTPLPAMPTPIVIPQPPPVIIQQAPVDPATVAPPPATVREAPSTSTVTDDTALQLKIEQSFRADPEIAVSNIFATVIGGKATLTGEVKSPALKQRAERLVREVKGIGSVENRVTVNPDMP
jgi:hypothetical protein